LSQFHLENTIGLKLRPYWLQLTF